MKGGESHLTARAAAQHALQQTADLLCARFARSIAIGRS